MIKLKRVDAANRRTSEFHHALRAISTNLPVIVVLTLTRIIKSVVTGQAFSHSGAEEYPEG